MKLQKLTTAILLGIATLLLVLGCETDSSSDDNPSPTTAITGTFRYEKLDINAQKDHSIQENAVKWDDDDNDAAANQTDNLLYRIAPGLPAGLEINEDTGEITGTPTKDSSSKLYTVTAKGKDKFSGSIDTTLYITVVDDTKTLIKGTFAYPNIDVIGATSVDMTANSQDPIPTWSEVAEANSITYTITPALPEGLSFVAATGAITGTSKNPVPKTQYKVTAIVGGTYGGTYTTSINITITEKFPITETGATLSYDAMLLNTNVDIDESTEGTPIWEKKPQGMIASYSIAPTSLPDGLIFDPATGAITGKSSVVVSKQEYIITVIDTANFYQGSIESKVSIKISEISFSYTSIAEGASGAKTPTFGGGGVTAADGDFSIVASGTGTVTATEPTIDTDNGDITVLAATTAGTYMVTFTLTSDKSIQVTVPFYVTTTPNNSIAELETALQTGIEHFGLVADFNYIQTSALTSMRGVFSKDYANGTPINDAKPYIENFNGDISKWTVDNVTNMIRIFYFASEFNGDISGWTVDNVTDMSSMFSFAEKFNGDVSGWKVDNVQNMDSVFYFAKKFNRDISGWNVGNVTSIVNMFQSARAFDQNLEDWGKHFTIDSNTGKTTGLLKTDAFLNSKLDLDHNEPDWY